MMKGRSKKPFKKSYGFGRDKKESEQDVSKNGNVFEIREAINITESNHAPLSSHCFLVNWNSRG